jgi:DNA-binding HxlR family transcriptional regulator
MPTNTEMKRSSQSPHDSILWELSNHGKMTKNMLRQRIGIRKAKLDIILADLEREGRILRKIGEDGELISLKDRL